MNPDTCYRRRAIRAAIRIHEHLLGPAHRALDVTLPRAEWSELRRLAKYLRHTQAKNWPAASRSLLQDLNFAALRLAREAELLREQTTTRLHGNPIGSA